MSNTTSGAVSIRSPDEVRISVDTLAEAMGRSSDDLMVEAIERYIAEEAWLFAEIQAGIAEADAGLFVPHSEIEEMVEGFHARARIAQAAS